MQVVLLFLSLSTFPALAKSEEQTSSASRSIRSPSLPQPIEVSWPDLVAAIDRHPRIEAGRLQIDAAQGGLKAAAALPNPEVEGSLGQAFPREGGASRVEWGLSLAMPLDWIAQRSSRVEAARAGVDLASAEATALRRDVLLQLRTLFWNLVFEQARCASLEALEAQTAELHQAIQRRIDKGELRPIEALLIEIEREKTLGELDAARAALKARRRALALWLSTPDDVVLVAKADLEALPDVMSSEAALSSAEANHPSIALSKAQTRSLAAELEIEKSARIPSFSIRGFASSGLDSRAYGAELAVDVPIWNWNSGRIAQAEARSAAGRKQAEAEWLEVQASVLEAQAACGASVTTAARFKNSMVPRSESASATLEKSYQLGEASLLEVIDARRTLLEARRLYLDALSQAQIDCSRLGVLVGEELQ